MIKIHAMFYAAGVLLLATRFTASAGETLPAIDESKNALPPNQQPRAVIDSNDPEFAGHFRGQVTGPHGKPVRGARIFLLPMSDGLNGELTTRPKADVLAIRARTDSEGRFEFDAPDIVLTDLDGLPTQRNCLVIAAAAGYGPDWKKVPGRNRVWGGSVVREPAKRTDLALQLASDDVPLHGQFLNPEGRPFAQARVRLAQLVIPKQRDLNTYLEYVTNHESALMNGPGYEGTFSEPFLFQGLTAETRTDAEGRFTLSGLGRERLAVLKVSAPSVVDTTIVVMTRETSEVGTHRLNGEAREVTYGARFTRQLKPGLTVTGLVRDRHTQQPIAGMWVGWRADAMNGLWSGEYSRSTDAQGRFTITGLDPNLLQWDQGHREVMAVSAPGLPYQTAMAEVRGDADVVIQCPRGIPFRLKLLDEQGQPVAAEVTYREMQPNPHLPRMPYVNDGRWPISRAAHRGGGIYEGFVLPGPGAVLVQTPGRLGYRSAHVDPKAFFAFGRTDWTAQERISAYGTQDTLSTSQVWINQHDYAAIVLVNPPQDSQPLALSGTVVKDKPRRVSLVDPDGKPVERVTTQGMTFHPWDSEPPLRATPLLVTNLHPDRGRRITFVQEDLQLIGFLMARGDSDAPYTVVMQPWGTVTGRLVDENGQELAANPEVTLDLGGFGLQADADPEVGQYARIEIDAAGRFQIDKLVPGQRYTAKVFHSMGMFAGLAFEGLVVAPGEVRDLGDIRTQRPVDLRGK